jgi:hypothetical protein
MQMHFGEGELCRALRLRLSSPTRFPARTLATEARACCGSRGRSSTVVTWRGFVNMLLRHIDMIRIDGFQTACRTDENVVGAPCALDIAQHSNSTCLLCHIEDAMSACDFSLDSCCTNRQGLRDRKAIARFNFAIWPEQACELWNSRKASLFPCIRTQGSSSRWDTRRTGQITCREKRRRGKKA